MRGYHLFVGHSRVRGQTEGVREGRTERLNANEDEPEESLRDLVDVEVEVEECEETEDSHLHHSTEFLHFQISTLAAGGWLYFMQHYYGVFMIRIKIFI